MNQENLLLKQLYGDIIQGYTQAESPKLGNFVIRHFGTKTCIEIDAYNYELFEKAKINGIPAEKERYGEIIKEGSWSGEKEKEIRENQLFIDNAQKSIKQLVYDDQIDQFRAEINETQDKINKLQEEKGIALGPTIESFVNLKYKEYFVIQSIYNDFTKMSKNKRSYDHKKIDNEILFELINAYNKYMHKFSEENLKKIALASFFMPHFCLSDNDPLKFYGKPIVDLTYFQVDLFIFGARFKNIVSDSDNIPDEIINDPIQLEEWYDKRQNFKKILDKNKGKSNVSIPGVTGDDLEYYGLSSNQVANTDKLIREAQKRPDGTLNLEDAINSGLI